MYTFRIIYKASKKFYFFSKERFETREAAEEAARIQLVMDQTDENQFGEGKELDYEIIKV